MNMLTRTQLVVSAAAAVLLAACLGASPGSGSTPPAIAPQQPATAAAPTVSSQPPPGVGGTTMSGTITLKGAPPPPDSSLFLGLVKSPSDQQPRTCIDAERNPVDAAGKFSARVACSPQAGDQLTYTLVIGPPGDRNWHTGFMPVPSDLTMLRLDTS